jgi:hypothetical protein
MHITDINMVMEMNIIINLIGEQLLQVHILHNEFSWDLLFSEMFTRL